MISLQDKNILITGASSGIGRECAVILSKIGAKVVIIGRDETRLNQTLALLGGRGHLSYRMNVTDFDNIESLVSDCVSKIGKLDGFVHCAGVELTMPLQIMNYSKSKSSTLLVIDFKAVWCGPCKAIKPFVTYLHESYPK